MLSAETIRERDINPREAAQHLNDILQAKFGEKETSQSALAIITPHVDAALTALERPYELHAGILSEDLPPHIKIAFENARGEFYKQISIAKNTTDVHRAFLFLSAALLHMKDLHVEADKSVQKQIRDALSNVGFEIKRTLSKWGIGAVKPTEVPQALHDIQPEKRALEEFHGYLNGRQQGLGSSGKPASGLLPEIEHACAALLLVRKFKPLSQTAEIADRIRSTRDVLVRLMQR